MGKQSITTQRRSLRYTFTEDEAKELARELANKNQEQRQLEEQKKSVVAEYGSRMTVVKENISMLSDKVASGYEMRDIQCQVEYHTPERNKKTVTRSDNGEVWVEPMVEADFNLFNQWEAEQENEQPEEGAEGVSVEEEEEPTEAQPKKGNRKKVA